MKVHSHLVQISLMDGLLKMKLLCLKLHISDFIIAIFDDFAEQLRKDSKRIVLLDNVPRHKSNFFQDKIEEWKEQDLIFYFLPTYSS